MSNKNSTKTYILQMTYLECYLFNVKMGFILCCVWNFSLIAFECADFSCFCAIVCLHSLFIALIFHFWLFDVCERNVGGWCVYIHVRTIYQHQALLKISTHIAWNVSHSFTAFWPPLKLSLSILFLSLSLSLAHSVWTIFYLSGDVHASLQQSPVSLLDGVGLAILA